MSTTAKPTQWNRRIRDWLLRCYPRERDFIGNFRTDAIFREVWERMQKGEDFYEICECGDSARREYVFDELANLNGCDYEVIYALWLHGPKA